VSAEPTTARPAARPATGALGEEAVAGSARLHVAGFQRARIQAAMAEACVELGAPHVTVAEVTSRAVISRRTFYEMFDGVEGCLLATLADALAEAGARADAAWAGATDWRERMRAALVALLAYGEEKPAVARLLVVESLAAGRNALELRADALARMERALAQGRSAGAGAGGCASPPELLEQGVLGGVLGVLYGKLSEPGQPRLLALANQLMALIALPYLGAAAAAAELKRPRPAAPRARASAGNPLAGVAMRLTYRTMRVLIAIGEHPGASNRTIARAAGIDDQGQMSKLLRRLRELGLIENTRTQRVSGTPNAWRLTGRGEELRRTIAVSSSTSSD